MLNLRGHAHNSRRSVRAIEPARDDTARQPLAPATRGQVIAEVAEDSGASGLKQEAPGRRLDAGRNGRRKARVLPPRIAQRFEVLSTDNGRSEDDLIGWWSLGEIADLLGMKCGTWIRKRNVHQWTYRLRNILAAGRYDSRLVRTDRKRGMRFALKRGVSPRITTGAGR